MENLAQTLKKNVQKTCIFGYPVDITTCEDLTSFVLDCMKTRQGIQIVTINPEIINAADQNPELAKIIREAELVIPESTGIMLALKSIGIFKAEKIPGIEFCEKLMQKCQENEFKVAFLGGSAETIKSLKIELQEIFPTLKAVFFHHGYFNKDNSEKIINDLKNAEPHILFVGMGFPKQEFFIKYNKNVLNKTVMIGVGGCFDVWSKKIKRAPVLFRRFGLEWFYRLLTQPYRATRMFPVLPLFFFKILFNRADLRKEYE